LGTTDSQQGQEVADRHPWLNAARHDIGNSWSRARCSVFVNTAPSSSSRVR
jgi:hypothetical protein